MTALVRMERRRMAVAALVALGVTALAVGHADAKRRSRLGFKGTVSLTATSIDPDARGKAKTSAKGDKGRFEVSASRLARRATYDVVVGGVKVATFTTSSGGSGKARLTSRPRGRDGLLGFDPRGVDVVVRDGAGHDVLFGTVVTQTSGDDAGEIICCEPDDSGPECEDRSPAECASKGGIATTATSCVPNPCAGALPPGGADVVCCIPDDSGPECEDRTPAECIAQGGTVVAATACTPNPCAATPSADPDIRCCLPDDGGPECEDRTPAECAAQGGVDLGAGTCAPDACAGVTF